MDHARGGDRLIAAWPKRLIDRCLQAADQLGVRDSDLRDSGLLSDVECSMFDVHSPPPQPWQRRHLLIVRE